MQDGSVPRYAPSEVPIDTPGVSADPSCAAPVHAANTCDANWAALDAALCEATAYPHPAAEIARIETHISVIYLAGPFAYKLKKPVAFGEFDFRTLATRQQLCEAELRLNHRLAPHLYLAVVPVTYADGRYTVDGTGPALEYLVKMVRFDQCQLFSQRLAAGRLDANTIDRSAALLADFHCHADTTPPSAALGSAALVQHQIQQICGAALQTDPHAVPIATWLTHQVDILTPHIDARCRNGFVRECHGDLHLDNLVMNGEVAPFDCIEFSDSLRWIDVISDLAFPVMDLWARGARHTAFRLLNHWLAGTGDYRGLRALPMYFAYRALVRAWALGAQGPLPAGAEKKALRERYLYAARVVCEPVRPALLLCHGYAGSGKSLASDALAAQLGAVRLCADLERKRSGPLKAATLHKRGNGSYTEQAIDDNYRNLSTSAIDILNAGLNLVVDASFLLRRHRRAFIQLARALDLPVWILDFHAPREILEQRVLARAAQAANGAEVASDANTDVLARQFTNADPLCGEEYALTLRFDGDVSPAIWHTPGYWAPLVSTLERNGVRGALT